MKTYSKEIRIDDLRLDFQEKEDNEIVVGTLKESTLYSNNKESILDSLIESYKLNHRHNPPKETERNFWNDHYLGEDLLLEYSFLISKNDDIIGALLSRKVEKPKSIFVEIIIFHEKSTDLKISVNILLDALLKKVSESEAFDSISFELDSIDPSSLEVLIQLYVQEMIQPSDILITLQGI